MSGDQSKLYTNGRLTTPTRKFVRSRVIRVFLGGQNDGDQAVSLAGMRVIAGAAAPPTPATPSEPTIGMPRPLVQLLESEP